MSLLFNGQGVIRNKDDEIIAFIDNDTDILVNDILYKIDWMDKCAIRLLRVTKSDTSQEEVNNVLNSYWTKLIHTSTDIKYQTERIIELHEDNILENKEELIQLTSLLGHHKQQLSKLKQQTHVNVNFLHGTSTVDILLTTGHSVNGLLWCPTLVSTQGIGYMDRDVVNIPTTLEIPIECQDLFVHSIDASGRISTLDNLTFFNPFLALEQVSKMYICNELTCLPFNTIQIKWLFHHFREHETYHGLGILSFYYHNNTGRAIKYFKQCPDCEYSQYSLYTLLENPREKVLALHRSAKLGLLEAGEKIETYNRNSAMRGSAHCQYSEYLKCESDKEKLFWLNLSANQGYKHAMCDLAEYLLRNEISMSPEIDQKIVDGLTCFTTFKSLNLLARHHDTQGRFHKAIKVFTSLINLQETKYVDNQLYACRYIDKNSLNQGVKNMAFRQGAMLGDPEFQYKYYMLDCKNTDLLFQSAEKGYGKSHYQLGLYYHKQSQHEKCMVHLLKAIDCGYKEARTAVSRVLNGNHPEKYIQ